MNKLKRIFWRNDARRGGTMLSGVALAAIVWGLIVGSLTPLAFVVGLLMAIVTFLGVFSLINGFEYGGGWSGEDK